MGLILNREYPCSNKQLMMNNQAVVLEEVVTSPSTTLSLQNCLAIRRFNYRTIDASNQKELQAFAERLQAEGQLTPIRIGVLSDNDIAKGNLL